MVTYFPTRLAANSFWLALARLFTQLLAAAFTILIARSLGESGLGQFSFIASLLYLANIATTFGTDTLLIREIASERAGSTALSGALGLQLSLSGLSILGFFLAAPLLPGRSPETILSIQVYSLTLLPLAFFTVFSAVIRAFERMDLYLLLTLALQVIQTGGAIPILISGGGLLSVFGWLAATQVLAALFAARLAFRLTPVIPIQWKISSERLLKTVKQSWPLALLAILGVLYQRLGLLMVAFLDGDAAAGWFSAAARIVESFKIFHLAFFGALYPHLASRLRQVDVAKTLLDGTRASLTRPGAKRYHSGLLLLVGFAFLVASALAFTGGVWIDLLFGPGFGPSIPALKILIWSLIPYTFSSMASLKLVILGRERLVVHATALSLIILAVLNFVLIPEFGPSGASLAVLAGEVILFLALTKAERTLSSRADPL